jgi:dehydration protein DpgD
VDVENEEHASVGRVLYERVGHIGWVTLNRPEVLNAMDLRMHTELAAVWDEVERDDEVWLVVLTGAGERAFSVGQDLKERARLDREGSPATSFGSRGLPGWPRLTERFSLSKPVLARVRGYALGGGFELVLACDLVVAAESAVFALPEAGLGLIPGAGGAFRLARQIPLKAAMGYLLTGRRMSASDALGFGLVNEVVPDAGLVPAVQALAERIASNAPLSVMAAKRTVYLSLKDRLDEAYAEADRIWDPVYRSADAQEGPAAFRDKRTPVWTGR